MNSIQTEELNGLAIKIVQDENPMDPREWDNLGTMVCFHRDYSLGDKKHGFASPSDLENHIKETNAISLPIYMMDHSGLSISTDPAMFKVFDSVGWDWGKLGYIFAAPDEVCEAFSISEITKDIEEKVLDILRNEIEVYNKTLSGEVYGYVIEDIDGNQIDSCWGFYDIDDCMREAKEFSNTIPIPDLANCAVGI